MARLVDWWLARKTVAPEIETRYRVLRRAITAVIVTVGLFSALLVIPQVRAVAGGLLASTAILGVIIGLASQQTLGNFIAGILIATTQPVRIGDRVELRGRVGRRGGDRPHLHVHPHASTAAARRPEQQARLRHDRQRVDPQPRDVSRRCRFRCRSAPISTAAVDALREDVADERHADVYVSSLDGTATVTLRAAAADEGAAERLEHELRLRAHRRLRALGVWA